MTFCPRCIKDITQPATLGRIGPYVLESLLGQGGMGSVYLAFHDSTSRAVALKVPRVDGKDRHALLRRFLQEARALSALDHPGILPIYEVGEEGGEPWFAMKLAEGGTLADLLARGEGRLPERQATGLLADIAAAVQYAHDRGVLHRDLKPQNILLDERGQPMLGDFGLARWEGHGASLSLTMVALGTPDYAAPEMAQGRAPSAAADIFSLGAILYHLLAGLPPFKADTLAATLTLSAEGRMEPLTSLGVSADLWQICRKCLEVEPADRYGTAGNLEADLRAWLEGAPVSVRQLSPTEKLRRIVRRNPLITALSLTTALAVVAAMALVIVADRRALRSERERAQLSDRLSEEQMHAANLAQVELRLASGRAGQRVMALETLRSEWKHKPQAALRSMAVRALSLGDLVSQAGPLTQARKFVVPEPLRELAAPAGGRRAVMTKDDGDGEHIEIHLADGTVETTLKLDGRIQTMAWNDRGDELALSCSAMRAYLWRAGSKEVVSRLRPRDSVTTAFAWHPKERYVAGVAADGVLWIWDLDRGAEIVSEPMGVTAKPAPQWSEDGRHLRYQDASGQRREVSVLFPTGVHFLRVAQPSIRRENFPTVTVEAKRGQVMWVTDKGVNFWNLKTGHHRQIVAKCGPEWMGAQFLAQGIQTCGWNSGLRGLTYEQIAAGQSLPEQPGRAPFVGGVLLNAAGEQTDWVVLLQGPAHRFILARAGSPNVQKFVPHPSPFSVSLNSDGSRLLSSSYQHPGVKVWDVTGKPRVTSELPLVNSASTLSESPDGSRVLAVGNERITIWEVSSGKLLATLLTDEIFNMGSWSPDGKLIAVQSLRGTQLFSAAAGHLVSRLPHPSPAAGDQHVSMAADAHQPWISEQLDDGSIIVWELDQLEPELQRLGMGFAETD
ncbi:MAG: WD40 repeat domain-containing serine/threonine protein kinase [Verrucomicrobium sp.]